MVVEKPWVLYFSASKSGDRRRDLGDFWVGSAQRQRSATCHFIDHLIAAPLLHEINGDKVVSGVIRHAEFNDAIPIVIGDQEQGQNARLCTIHSADRKVAYFLTLSGPGMDP